MTIWLGAVDDPTLSSVIVNPPVDAPDMAWLRARHSGSPVAHNPTTPATVRPPSRMAMRRAALPGCSAGRADQLASM